MNLARIKGIAKYALYDAGNSNYVTLIPSLVFPVFFLHLMPKDSTFGDFAWGGLIAVATLLAAALGPRVGEWADHYGRKFALLRWTSLLAIAGTALMPTAGKFGPWPMGALFVLTEACYLLATVLYDSALSDVSTADDAAEISSFAWGVGYAGGVVGLLLALSFPGAEDRVMRAAFYIAAALFLLFAMPLMLHRDPPPAPKARERRRGTVETIRAFMRDPVRFRMLIAYFLYVNGVSAVIYFTAAYASKTLHYDLRDLLKLFIAMNLVAAPASMLLGKLGNKMGHIPALRLFVGAWILAVIGVALADRKVFAVVACGAAALLGPVQALSRSLFRIIFPEDSMASYFGVQAMASRASALVGPLWFGLVSWVTGSQRIGALAASLLFAAGLYFLFRVPKDAEHRTPTEPADNV
jgi:UMF1 family MFS transporter